MHAGAPESLPYATACTHFLDNIARGCHTHTHEHSRVPFMLVVDDLHAGVCEHLYFEMASPGPMMTF
jgi:hypothetical protein